MILSKCEHSKALTANKVLQYMSFYEQLISSGAGGVENLNCLV